LSGGTFSEWTMSSSEESDHDDSYHAFRESEQLLENEFPLHDCCEFEDIEALRVSRKRQRCDVCATSNSFR